MRKSHKRLETDVDDASKQKALCLNMWSLSLDIMDHLNRWDRNNLDFGLTFTLGFFVSTLND